MPKTIENKVKPQKKIGFILRNLRKILIYYNLIGEDQYMIEWLKEKEIGFFNFLMYVILNGILWSLVFIIPIIIFGFAEWIPVLVLSAGTLRYLIKEAYEERISIQRNRGGK